MYSKPLGMKVKHMGMKWMKVDDQLSIINRDLSKNYYEPPEDLFEDFPEARVIESLNNVTFEIPEDPEYNNFTPTKLIFDEYPEKLTERKRKVISKSMDMHPKKYKSPSSGAKKPGDTQLRNLYYHLHRPSKARDYEKFQDLQNSIKSSNAAGKYISYLQKKNYRVPSYLQNPYDI